MGLFLRCLFSITFFLKRWGYCSEIVSTQLPFLPFNIFFLSSYFLFFIWEYIRLHLLLYWNIPFCWMSNQRNVRNPLHSNSYFDSILLLFFIIISQQATTIFYFISIHHITRYYWSEMMNKTKKRMMKLFCIKSHKAQRIVIFSMIRVETK